MSEATRRVMMLGTAAAMVAGAAHRVIAQGRADKTTIDHILLQATDTKQVPGVVALASTDKGVFYQGAFGKRSLAPGGADMTVDSVFWIASMTKAVTSTAAMQQVELGKLSLDQPISSVLPELASPQVLEGFDVSGAPKLRPAKRPVTLRHLLTHTSGFTYDFFNADTTRYNKASGLPGIISCKNAALGTPLAFDPGDRWEYGINIDWAGKAVERVSGQKLSAYFQEHLFGPLGMGDTGFKLTAAQRARLVGMHARQPDGSLQPIDFEIPQEPEFEMGGGGLYSTAADYMRFCQMFLHAGQAQGGAQVLRPETVALMGQNQMGEINVAKLRSVDPASSLDAEFFPGMVKKWSTGFMLNTVDAPTGRSAGSMAWAGLANTYFWIDPKRRVAGVILMQFLPFADQPALQTLSEFETASYKALEST